LITSTGQTDENLYTEKCGKFGETATHVVLKTQQLHLTVRISYLFLVRPLQTCIKQNHHVLQVFRMACLVKVIGIHKMIQHQINFHIALHTVI